MLHHDLLSSTSLFLAQSDTILSEEITWLERQPRNDSRNLILGSVRATPTNGCNNQVITTGSCECSDATDNISRPPDTSLYHGLEGLDGTSTIINRALSALDEQSSERPRSDSDYEEPELKGACAAIGSQSKGREKEAVYENANPAILTDAAGSSDTLDGNDEYCYSYTTDLSLKDEKSRSDEEPKTDGPLHHSLEGALEGAPAMTNDDYTPMEGLSELGGYQPLQKPTRPEYQSLRKTTTEAPRGALTRK